MASSYSQVLNHFYTHKTKISTLSLCFMIHAKGFTVDSDTVDRDGRLTLSPVDETNLIGLQAPGSVADTG